jgi:hypothetical protein
MFFEKSQGGSGCFMKTFERFRQVVEKKCAGKLSAHRRIVMI